MDDMAQEDYRGKEKLKKLSMKQIILQQIKTIMELGSKEMRGGYDEETIVTIDGQPQILKKYIEDGRQSFCNAILLLDSAVCSYVVDEDDKEQKRLLTDLNKVKKEQADLYDDYLEELEKKGVDRQEIKFEYFTEKKKIYENIFKKLMRILRRSDFFNEEEDAD